MIGDQDGETSGCSCSCPLNGDLTSSACVSGCMVNGVYGSDMSIYIFFWFSGSL